MKTKKILLNALLLLAAFAIFEDAMAQCAMCNETARTATEGKNENAIALNNGILYLMVLPYIMLAIIGFLWWKYGRKKKNQNIASQ
ncbi:MAG: hypothetical protein N2167_09230 [Flavobacteriales bacterium]|nr:hypothetical protein [Flavobacteriales bacterium]